MHNHVSNRLHCIFTTKERLDLIPKEFQPRLWAYIDSVAKNIGLKTFATGGIANHCHTLIGLPPAMSLSIAMQKIKANSSRFAAEELGKFAWQANFSAFSVSISHMDATIAYIRNQERHHRRKSFDEEMAEILAKHGL